MQIPLENCDTEMGTTWSTQVRVGGHQLRTSKGAADLLCEDSVSSDGRDSRGNDIIVLGMNNSLRCQTSVLCTV